MEHSATTHSSASFMGIPPEIRLQIYNLFLSELLGTVEPSIVIRSNGSHQHMRFTKSGLALEKSQPLQPLIALTNVSRSLRIEVTPLLYSQLHFKIFSYCDEKMNLGATYRHACTLELGNPFFRHIKHMNILISIFCHSSITTAVHWLGLFARYLDAGQAELESLSVTFRSYIQFGPSRANGNGKRFRKRAAKTAKLETLAVIDEAKVAERLNSARRVWQMLDVAQVDNGL